MKIKLLYLLVFMSTFLKAQNAADVDLVLGSGYKGFSFVSVIKQQTDGKILVAGRMQNGPQSFTWEAIMARFNIDGSVDTSFEVPPLINTGVINDVVIQTDGKILVGGNFSMMNGTNVNHIIRLNPDGSLDQSFVASLNGAVNSMVLQPDGKIIIASNATAFINEHTQRYVFRLNTNGTFDNTFDTGDNGFPGASTTVLKVALQEDGKIIASGGFNTFNGLPQGKLIRFHNNGDKDTSFDIGTGVLSNNTINEILVQPDGKILIGGGFMQWNGQNTGPLCRLNSNGSLDPTFTLGVTSVFAPQCARQPDGKIIAIGSFTINGTNKRIVRLNNDGSLDSGLENVQTGNAINCLALQSDDKILVGGFFDEINGVGKNNWARLQNDGSLDVGFNLNSGLNGKVNAIALSSDGKTLLGGDFTTFDGVSQNRIIRILEDGSLDTTFNIGLGFNDEVFDIAIQSDGKILIGGSFTQFNGTNTSSLVRLNTNGTLDNTFSLNGGFNSYVKTMAIQTDGKLVVGGNFTSFDGIPQNYCIRLNSNGTKDNAFVDATAFNDRVTCLKIQADGKMIVGGNFTTFNNQPQKHLIRLNIDGSKDPLFDIGNGFNLVNNQDVVRDIEIAPNGSVYVTAFSGFYNNILVKMPIRLNVDGSLDTSFMSAANISGSSTIDALGLQQNGKIILGGTFQSIIGVNPNQRRLMRLNSDGTFDETFDVSDGNPQNYGGFDTGVCSEILIQPDGKIWLGGSFFNYRNITSFSAIRLSGDGILSSQDHELKQNDVKIYPNPVQNVLHLNENYELVRVYDVSGKLIMHFEKTQQLDFSSYPTGIYILSLKNKNGNVISQKIVKN